MIWHTSLDFLLILTFAEFLSRFRTVSVRVRIAVDRPMAVSRT
jgi:hypothetical protein